MSKERFLLYMLAGIFTFQAGVFSIGVYYCSQNGGLQFCPELGKRYDHTFSLLKLLTNLMEHLRHLLAVEWKCY